ncbi:nitrosoguanidine resistance protein SNG1 [Leptodontidium sp. MPI-SDFR-AT-0119]|nr:nitrosoguanidine resistance protein SNG1 [Leptodontidium sp. MPI-SDFR-AT-0119]
MATIVWGDPFWNGKRKGYVGSLFGAGIMLYLLFLTNMAYLYGSLYRSGHRVNALNVLAVDYDGGVFGLSLSAAYSGLESDHFPSLYFRDEATYPTAQDVQNAVCRGDYWAAIFVHSGASNRLSAALNGGSEAETYEANNTITYIFNAARYAPVALGNIEGSLETLIGAGGSAYHAINGSYAINHVNVNDPTAVLAFTSPIRSSSINLVPTPQGTKVFYNTITLVLPMLQQFFFLMALNGISSSYGIYGRLHSTRIGFMRIVLSLVYTFIASLAVAGCIWAFREDWRLGGAKFTLTWMVFCFVPPQFLSFIILTWIITNVASAIYPFELSPGIYRVGYALPAHEVYALLVQIWSGGCNNKAYRALPILFAWEVVGIVSAAVGMSYRNRKARNEIQELERKYETDALNGVQRGPREEAEEAEELTRIETRGAGPSFPMPFLPSDSRHLLKKMETD